jgi:hypothetical protein
MLVALAGRRIDSSDAQIIRFSLEMKETVYKRILRFFQENNVTALISSAACGADLLAQKAAHEINNQQTNPELKKGANTNKIEQYIILPFERERFRKTSVTDRPGDWGEMFDKICDEVKRQEDLIVLNSFENEEKAYSTVTTEILNQAESLKKTKYPDEKIVALVVREGIKESERDETEAFARKAAVRRIPVVEISTR